MSQCEINENTKENVPVAYIYGSLVPCYTATCRAIYLFSASLHRPRHMDDLVGQFSP